jgi:PAS domain-containing protein
VTTDRRSKQELPEAVKTLIETRTGDAVYVVGPDYTIVHWDQNMEALSGVLSEEANGLGNVYLSLWVETDPLLTATLTWTG